MEEKAPVTDDSLGAMFLGEDPDSPEVFEEDVQEPVEDVVEDEQAEEVEDQPEEENEPEEASEDDTEESDLVEVEWDGQLIEAPKAIAEALMRQSDYTQKTQEVAQQRKAVEAIQGQLEQTKQQYEFAQSIQEEAMQAQMLDQTVQQWNSYLRENLDSLSSTDIEKIRFQIQDTQNQRAEIQNSLQAKQQEFQQAQEQSYKELLNKGTEVLQQRIPGWGEAHQKQVRDYAVSNGFSEAELSTVVDPRQVEILYKASQYDALKSGAKPAVNRVKEAPTIKPKSRNPMPKETQDKLNLRKQLKSKKLSSRDKQSLVMQDIANRWA